MVLIRDVLLIGFCCALLAFVGASKRSLTRASEGRVAQVAQEMRETGDWVVPHLNGQVRVEKPPLSSWLVAAVSIAAGAARVESWHAAVPPGVAAVLLALLVYVWLRMPAGEPEHNGGRVPGMMAALVLATAPGFVLQARSAELDMLLALWVALAFWGYWEYRRAGRKGGLLLAYGALGLSVLTKGHVGAAIILPALLCWEIRERYGAALPLPQKGMARWHLAGAAVLCLVVVPWGIPFLQQSGITWQDFSKEGLQRFGDKTGHGEVRYWYLLQMPGWFMPWFLLLPLALWQTWRRSADERSPLRRLCWAWLGWGVLLLSALTAKQRHYAIPLFPPLAMLIGDAVARWLAHCEPSRRRLAHLVLGALGGLMALAALGAPLLAARAGMVAPADERVVWFSAASAALFFLIGAGVVLRRDRGFSLWWAAFICAVVVFALTKEKQEAAEGPEDFCRQVREKVPPAAVLYDYDAALPRRAKARRAVWRAQVLFYLQRRVTVSDEELTELLGNRRDVYALVTQKHLDAVPQDLYEVLARVPRFLDHRYSVALIEGRGAGKE